MAENLKLWVWLSSIPQIGAVKGRLLLEHFGDISGIWDADELDLNGLSFLTPANVKNINSKKHREQADRHFENIYRYGIKITTILDKNYPEYLKNIYDPPVVIYSKGTLKSNEKIVAVVGSRKATSYGLSVAKSISRELAHNGITVASGMARGVDSYAHMGALEGKGRTLAVLGCGLDTVYPRENKGLMEEIEGSGCVMSEYIPGVKPMPQNFPARNRIISGLSLGVIVIEASDGSGSLITADFALEQGREVFAVPGNLDSINSKGTNRLIKDGAKMVTNIDDVLEELKMYVDTSMKNIHKKAAPVAEAKFYDLEEDELKVVRALERGPCNVDSLADECRISIQNVNSLITMLELKGIVDQLPGKIIRMK